MRQRANLKWIDKLSFEGILGSIGRAVFYGSKYYGDASEIIVDEVLSNFLPPESPVNAFKTELKNP